VVPALSKPDLIFSIFQKPGAARARGTAAALTAAVSAVAAEAAAWETVALSFHFYDRVTSLFFRFGHRFASPESENGGTVLCFLDESTK